MMFCVALFIACDANYVFVSFCLSCDALGGTQFVLFLLVRARQEKRPRTLTTTTSTNNNNKRKREGLRQAATTPARKVARGGREASKHYKN